MVWPFWWFGTSANRVELLTYLLAYFAGAGIQFNATPPWAYIALICEALRRAAPAPARRLPAGRQRPQARLHTSTKDLSRSHRPVRWWKQTIKPYNHGQHPTEKELLNYPRRLPAEGARGLRGPARPARAALLVHWSHQVHPPAAPSASDLDSHRVAMLSRISRPGVFGLNSLRASCRLLSNPVGLLWSWALGELQHCKRNRPTHHR